MEDQSNALGIKDHVLEKGEGKSLSLGRTSLRPTLSSGVLATSP